MRSGAAGNPDYFGAMAERLGGLFGDYTLDVFEERHHFDPAPGRAGAPRGAAARDLGARARCATG